MILRKERDGKRRKRGDGWQGKYGLQSFLPLLSLLMDGRSDSVVSARRRACGQGRSVEDAKQTLRQYCKVRTSRLCQPRLGGVVRTRLHQESAKTVLAHDAHWAKETELRELGQENKLLKKRKDIVGVVRGRW